MVSTGIRILEGTAVGKILPWGRFRVASALLIGVFVGACQNDPGGPLTDAELAEPGAAAARLFRLDACSDAPSVESLSRQMVDAINAERAKQHLTPLKVDPTLTQIADFYACRLAEGGFFSHVDPYDASTVDSRATSFGYPFQKIGENLAVGQRTVDEVLKDWMNSPGHRSNILDPAYSEIGIAVKVGGTGGPYWVQEFGRPYVEGDRTVERSGKTPATGQTSSAPSALVDDDRPVTSQSAKSE